MVKYEPNKWNKNKHITHSHNCYSYFLNKISPVEELRCKAIEKKWVQQINVKHLNLDILMV